MAARKVSTGKGNDIVVINQPPATPARRRSSSRRRSPVKRRSSSRRRRYTPSLKGYKGKMTAVAVGGFGVGFIEKQWGDQIPELPFLGRKGTIAAFIYFMEPKQQWLQDIGVAAAAISGYELGKTGSVSGIEDPYYGEGWDDDDDDDEGWDDDEDIIMEEAA